MEVNMEIKYEHEYVHMFPYVSMRQASKFIGTLQYMAPEVVIARGDDFDASDAGQVATVLDRESHGTTADFIGK